jgi:hypothetical protein
VFERKYLDANLQRKRLQEDAKMHTEGLQNSDFLQNSIRVIKQRRFRWTGHAAPMEIK